MMHENDYEGVVRAVSIEKAITVRDLIEPKGTFKTSLLKGRLIALDGHNGKKLFDTKKNKQVMVEKYYNARVIHIWPEIVTEDTVYGNRAESITKIYLDHNTINDERERPTAVPFDYLSTHKCRCDDDREMYPNSTLEVDVAVQTIEDYLKECGFESVDFLEALGVMWDEREAKEEGK